MLITPLVSLKPYNTFGLEARARLFTTVRTLADMQELIAQKDYQANARFILGGGSNILLIKDVDALVIKNELKGIVLAGETEEDVLVTCAAGEVWHEFVMYCIGKGYAGIENLSLIPGNTGASPMQNIGAYGVEIKDCFHELEAIDLQSGEVVRFSKSDCEFGYRESVFKRKYKDRYMILSVTYRLSKKPVFHTEYGAIRQELDHMGISELSIKAISQAVINIRSGKLPDPKKIGNAGSFFKNPEVSATTYRQLLQDYPALVAYPLENGNYKLAAGWLIEQSGLKGYRRGDAGVHSQQALVLVNYGQATGREIYELSSLVLDTVQKKFGVQLEREVNIIA